MWKIVVGFVIFAAIALYVISMGGDKIDMSGEKHGGDTTHAPATPAPAAAPAAPASAAASAPAAAASAAK